MEDPNRDSDDTETSSEGSWILLNNDEAIADLTSLESNKNCIQTSLHEMVNQLNDVETKNIQSDSDSDGISIISESDYSQNSENDDDCKNTAIDLQIEKDKGQKVKEDISKKVGDFLKEMDIGEQNLIILNNENSLNDTLNRGECSLNVKEKVADIVLDKDIPDILESDIADIMESEEKPFTENLSSQIITDTLKEETSFFHLNHLKKLITWPAFLCTSMVIFAVIIFPYFSSKIDNANSLEQPDKKQFDEISLAEKNVGVLDSLDLMYCMEIIKEETDNPYFKQCVKRLLKHMKRFKNNDNGVQSILRNKGESEEDKAIEYTDAFHVKQKYKDKELYDKQTSGSYNKFSRNFQMPLNFVSEYYYSSDEDMEQYNQKEKDINEDKETSFKTQFEKITFDKSKEELNDLRNSLLAKEKLLKEWQEQLTERERYLEKKIKEMRSEKKKHFGKLKKQKGDFDRDMYKHKYNRDRNQMSGFMFKEKQKKYDKHFKHPDECEDCQNNFGRPGKHNNKKTNKAIHKMKSIFSKKNQRDYKGKKGAVPVFVKENFHKDSSKNFSVTFNFNYSRMPTVMKKNRTKIMDDDNVTVNGDWYLNLVNGRHDIRKREGRASWWFDRAEFRKNRRNKAFWYFQYMVNRENLRYRQKNF